MAPEARAGDRAEAPYSAFWQFPAGGDSQEYVEAQLGAWLREKGFDVDLALTAVHRRDGSRLFIGRHDSRSAPEFQAKLVEHNEKGTWITELTTRGPRRAPGWVRLRVTSDRGHYVAPPRIAKYLLTSGLFRDGGELNLTERPTLVSSPLVQDVAEVITDFSREGLVFVAGTDEDLAFDPFFALVEEWTREVVGLAEVYVLDPIATRAMAEILGPSHAVEPWTIRTFLPDVDPAVEENGRRHRWLSTSRLVDWPKPRIQRSLGRIARGHAESRPLPDHVMHSLRGFVRLENQLIVDAVGRADELEARLESATREAAEPGPAAEQAPGEAAPVAGVPASATEESVADQAAEYLRRLDLVRQVFAVDEVTEESLRAFMAGLSAEQQQTRLQLGQRLAEQEEEIAQLREKVAEQRRVLDEAELDLAITVTEREELADTVQWLRRQFVNTPQVYLTSAPIPAEELTTYPRSFSELLDWLDEGRVPGVRFTGDPDQIVVLDLHSGMDVALRNAYDIVLALSDYARVKSEGWSGSMETYLRTPPDGCRSVGVKKHAATESETVVNRPRFARRRLLPVPVEVSADGAAYMYAHFKLGVAGMLSPRMHYLDDTGGTGLVYVGYIGKHLENTKTN